MSHLACFSPSGDAVRAPPELQRLLSDQTQRGEKHRANYQTLKEQHGLLREKLVSLHTELALLRAERQSDNEKFQQLLAKLQQDLHAKDQFISELQARVPSREQSEYRQLQIREEVTAQISDKLLKAEEAVEEMGSEVHALKYQCDCLEAGSDQLRQQHSREMQELRVAYDAQISQLQTERDQLRTFRIVGEEEEAARLLPLEKENSALQLRLRNQLNELQEERAQADHAHTERIAQQRSLERRHADISVALRVSVTERAQLKSQTDTLRQQLMETQQRLSTAELQIQREAGRVTQLTSQLVENKQLHKRQVADLQMEVSRFQGEADQERAAALRQIQELEHRLALSNDQVAAMEEAAADIEHQLERRVAQARDRDWSNTRMLRKQLIEVESKLQETRREIMQNETEKTELAKQCQQRLAEVCEIKKRLDTELAALKSKTNEYHEVCSELEEQRDNASTVRQELNAETSIVSKLSREIKQIREEKMNTESALQNKQTVIQDLQRSVMEQLSQAADVLTEKEREWLSDRVKLQQQLKHVELRRLHAQEERDGVRNKYGNYARLINKLRRRMELCQAETQQLAAERDALKRCVPEHIYNEQRKQHRQLQRKHREFSSMIMSMSVPQQTSNSYIEPADLVSQLQLLKARINSMQLAGGVGCSFSPISLCHNRYRCSPAQPSTSAAQACATGTDGAV